MNRLSCSTVSDDQDTHALCSGASVRRAAWECLSHLKARLDRVSQCNNCCGTNSKEKLKAWKQEVNKPSSSPTDICCRSMQSKAASSCLITRYRMIQGRTEKKYGSLGSSETLMLRSISWKTQQRPHNTSKSHQCLIIVSLWERCNLLEVASSLKKGSTRNYSSLMLIIRFAGASSCR